MSLVPPTRRKLRRSSTRSSFTCSIGLISPISSRSTVPPFPTSMSPSFCARASVKAPRSWPNSSVSSSSLGMAAQLISTNGWSWRALIRWIRLAKYSLPVPLSPSIRTLVVSPSATCSAIA